MSGAGEGRTERDAVNVKFWDCDREREALLFTDIGEAVSGWADAQPKPLPETVTVYGWAPMPLPSPNWPAERALDDLLASLDDELGNPEEETTPTEEMKAAALDFVKAVFDEYPVYMCEQVTSRVVKVADYYTPLPANAD